MTWEYEGHTGKVNAISIRSALVKGFVPDCKSVFGHNNKLDSVTMYMFEKKRESKAELSTQKDIRPN